MRIPLAFASLMTILVGSVMAGSSVAELESRNTRDNSTPQGKAYETKAVQAFWGDARFMPDCAPPDAPISTPLIIYAEIKPSGQMGELAIVPKNSVANCIAKHVRSRMFPPPPHLYVLKIDLVFTK